MHSKLRENLGLIFDAFDSIGNNRISSTDIDLDRVPPDIILIFKPLLIEMEQYGESLDREEFIESALVLVNSITIDRRSLILNFSKKPRRTEPLSHRPKISDKSRQLARIATEKKA